MRSPIVALGKYRVPDMRSRGAPATVAVALILLLTGCAAGGDTGSSATPSDTSPISYATGPTDLVLQVSSGGGLLPQSLLYAEMPDVSIYGDGRVIRLGLHRTGAADPLLPELIETRVTADGIARILGAARDAALLGPDRRYDLPGAYDLGTVLFVVTANGTTHSVSAFGLGFSGEEQLAPPGEMGARRSLSALFSKLLNLRTWLPSEAVGPDSAYQPGGIRVFLTRLVDWSTAVGSATRAPATPAAGQEVRDWPIADLLPESFGKAVDKSGQWYCAVVRADEAALFGLGTATWDTRWRAAGNLYQIVAAPLLPHESGCHTGT